MERGVTLQPYQMLYPLSMPQSFKVTDVSDHEAKVFTSSSTMPVLVVEADTFEEFVSLVEVLAPICWPQTCRR